MLSLIRDMCYDEDNSRETNCWLLALAGHKICYLKHILRFRGASNQQLVSLAPTS